MELELASTEKIRVTFRESDGFIEITFGKNAITVKADLPDTQGRQGIIYKEKFIKPEAKLLRQEPLPCP